MIRIKKRLSKYSKPYYFVETDFINPFAKLQYFEQTQDYYIESGFKFMWSMAQDYIDYIEDEFNSIKINNIKLEYYHLNFV